MTLLDVRCDDLGHPGVTYNPWLNRTWCACGKRSYTGEQIAGHVACCGGPLDTSTHPELAGPAEQAVA